MSDSAKGIERSPFHCMIASQASRLVSRMARDFEIDRFE